MTGLIGFTSAQARNNVPWRLAVVALHAALLCNCLGGGVADGEPGTHTPECDADTAPLSCAANDTFVRSKAHCSGDQRIVCDHYCKRGQTDVHEVERVTCAYGCSGNSCLEPPDGGLLDVDAGP